MKNNKTILVSVALVYRQPMSAKKKPIGKPQWFIVRSSENDPWELPKTTVRKGESSVRAVIRQMAEQGGMRTKVLEEVGRSGGSTSIGGKIMSQRTLYYLMVAKGDSEVLGFTHFEWMEYEKAKRRLESKKDQGMLMRARDLSKQILKERKKNQMEDFEDELNDIPMEEQPESK